MKLKLSVAVVGALERDVVLVADATATIGDVAKRLCAGSGMDASHPLTLRVEDPGSTEGLVLDPACAIEDSSLRAGRHVEVVRAGERRPDDERDDRVAAVVRVVAGPDAGRTFRIARGTSLVGRDASAAVRFHEDREVSRRHATLTVDRAVTVTDLNSANGLRVDGALVRRAEVGAEKVQVGATVFQVEPVADLGPERAPDDFVRSASVERLHAGVLSELPVPPSRPDPPRLPVLALLSPLLLGAVLFALSRQPSALLFVAVSPLIMLGTWFDGRLRARRSWARARKRFDERLADVRSRAIAEREREREARELESPAVDEVERAIHTRSSTLWARTPVHAAFLEVRFGRGSLPSRSRVTPSSANATADADAVDGDRLRALEDEFAKVGPVPVVESFPRAGALGIAGGGTVRDDAARALVMQLVGMHSPADLTIAAFIAPDAVPNWAWLAWLPHVDSPHSPITATALAADEASAAALLSSLEELVATRNGTPGSPSRSRGGLPEATAGIRETAASDPSSLPSVVVVVTDGAPAERSRLVELASAGADHGVYTVWLAGSPRRLPNVCRTQLVVDPRTGRGTVGYVRHGTTVPLQSLDLLDAIRAETAARALAPLTDSGARVPGSELPRAVSFAELYGTEVLEGPTSIEQRWRRNGSLVSEWTPGEPRSPMGLRAVVGQAAPEPFAIDLRSHGPHALVGGTTGSGKSEFLQAWIMGLAAEYAPDRLTFLLVDYKGGSAFAECVRLPHTVGLVTDLTPLLVRRALTSLRAELRQRERILNAKNAKDLLELERRGDRDAPPALVIVVDEFAALSGEVPEFMDGVVDIAQRGRSLGLHLVLATQRPSGVIRGSLRANTNLRIALRVADDADSQDILGSPIAAGFDPERPGRAAASDGSGRVVEFQSAFLGLQTGQGPAAPDIEVHPLPLGRGGVWPVPADPVPEMLATPDIERLARCIREAAARCRIATPRRPWLEPLGAHIDVLALPAGDGARLALGMLDQPGKQRQTTYMLDLDAAGNVAIIGASGSGKSAALRSLGLAASTQAAARPVVVHVIDSAGGTVTPLETLPTTSSVVLGTDTERITRMLTALTREAERRARAFAATRATSLGEYQVATGIPLARVLVLLDGFSAFRAEHEFRPGGDFDRILALASSGRQLGMHVVVTADRVGALPPAFAATMGELIVLRLAGAAEYASAGLPVDALTDAPPGRALIRGDECQLGVPGGGSGLLTQTKAIDEAAQRLRATGVVQAAPIERLPERIDWRSLPSTVCGRPTLGVAYETLEPVGMPDDGLFIVAGPFGSGRTTAMTTAIRSMSSARPHRRRILISTRRGALAGLSHWSASSADPDAAAALAAQLAGELEAGRDDETPPLIVVDSVGDHEGAASEAQVVRLLKAARRVGASVLVEVDPVTAPAAWQLFAELKTARAGIVLRPDESDGSMIFRIPFPRGVRAEFPVGRGFLVEAGRITLLQVALPPTSALDGDPFPARPGSTKALQALSVHSGRS